jgi:hypothetical protein
MNLTSLSLFLFVPVLLQAQTLTSALPLNSSGPVRATSADAFVDSIGVATHWGWYPSQSTLESLLVNSGIRHIRDGAVPTAMRVLHAGGITETMVIDPVNGIIPNSSYWSGQPASRTSQIASYIKTQMPAGSVDAVEGPNELDVFYKQYKWHPSDVTALSSSPSAANYYGLYGTAVMKDLWTAIKSDPALASIKVIGPAVGTQVPSSYAAGALYNVSDYGNFHPYPGRTNTYTYPQPYDTITKYYWNSYQPSSNIGSDPYGGNPLLFNWYKPPFASGSSAKPMIATETGYQTSTNSGGVSVLAQAKYVPRLYAEYFRNGIARTFTYELYDEGSDQENTEHNFGLIYNNLSPKPAFIALQSLIGLLEEPGASFTPGTLAYSLNVKPNGAYTRTAYVHELLLQKSDGRFYLLLWHEVSDSSNTDATGNQLTTRQRDISPAALTTTICLPSSIHSAILFSYTPSWTLQSAQLSVVNSQVTIPVGDTVSVLELEP